MATVRLSSEGHVYDVDFTRFTLGEAIVLQEATGIDVQGLGDRALAQDLPTVGAIMWLIRLREITAETGCTTKQAAAQLPHERFIDQVDLVSLTVEVVDGPKSRPARTPATGTRRTTPAARPTRGRRAASGKSAASPSASESAPGS